MRSRIATATPGRTPNNLVWQIIIPDLSDVEKLVWNLILPELAEPAPPNKPPLPTTERRNQ
ncbi:MAG: hypothetical protein U0Y68_06100 [Blastocatellia bacterium]